MNLKRQIRRCVQSSAERYGVSIEDVLNMTRTRAAVIARRHAIRKLLRYTGCSQAQLAEAWGIDPASVKAAVRDELPLRSFGITEPVAASESILAKLAWQYGANRARQIVAGGDPATQADIEAWCMLGRKDAA